VAILLGGMMLFEMFMLCLMATAYLVFIATLMRDAVKHLAQPRRQVRADSATSNTSSAVCADKEQPKQVGLCRGRRLRRGPCDALLGHRISISPSLTRESRVGKH
jgi:hypothetical protein